jgi:hypothetical protein
MELKVVFSEDPAFVLSRAGVFLSSQPVLHNLVLSILHTRVAQGDPGRYWMAIQREDVVGVLLQSPLTFPATLTPMEPPVVTAMANAIADAGIPLPGVNAEARQRRFSRANGASVPNRPPHLSRGTAFMNFWRSEKLPISKARYGRQVRKIAA